MPGFEWDLGMVVMSEYDADGFIGIGFDNYGEKNSGVAPGELHSPYGFLSRPLDPDTDGDGNPKLGCSLWRAFEGNVPHHQLAQDPRVVPDLPELKKGESIHHGAAHNFVRCHEDGSVTVMTTADGTATGQTIFLRVSPTDIMVFAPWGKFAFDANGLHVFTRSGARLDMGGIGGLPSPLSALNSYAKLSGKVVSLEGTIVAIGPAGVPADAVAKTTPILTVLAAVQSAISAVGALAAAATPTPASAAAATAASAALAALATAVTAAAVAIPSNSATVT